MKVFKVKYKKGGLKGLAMVKNPAIEEKFIRLSNHCEENFKPIVFEKLFSLSDIEKREILTPLLIPDKMIMRRMVDVSSEPFYITFDAPTIKEISFDLINNKDFYFNIEHLNGERLNDIFISQIFLKDSKIGLNPLEYNDLPDGTLFSVLRIENLDVWNEILKGTFEGVSLEIISEFEEVKSTNLASDEVTESERVKNILDLIRRNK